ncbi:DUF5776 domain-containing protein [Levilactobacillus cerevisiae]|uniref:DUF5776 domain-containing protein n=1 Tax=Levilactobacillus cerevisiae TaxID=1704076 RepID=UPI000F78E1A3|nr:DUF5776 domain-containing protein [Levilactobacillus cerevisiae]
MWLAGLCMGAGLVAGMSFSPVVPARAATQVSTATKTSAATTLSDAEFEKEITDPVSADQPIKDVFKDPKLAQIVADGLHAGDFQGVDTNLQTLMDAYKGQEYNTQFSVVPSSDQTPGTATVSNWTGLSALADFFEVIEVDDQPDFNTKATELVKEVGHANADLSLTFNGDDMTTTGFNQLIDLTKLGFGLQQLGVKDNQITDFSAIDRLPNSGLNAPITGIRESGSVEESSALMVHNSSVVIKGGVPGAELLPKAVINRENDRVGLFRLETPAQTADYLQNATEDNLKRMPEGNVASPVTFAKLNALNQVDFNNHDWQNVYPWAHAQFANGADLSDLAPEDIFNLCQTSVQNIPNNVQSLTIRSEWANGFSQGYPISTLVKIPLTRESSQSHASIATSSGDKAAAQSSVASQSVGPKIAKKGQAVYALKKVGLYRQPTFTQRSRQNFYPRESRIHRPQFVVTGYARSKQGRLRYQVRDVNHHSVTFNHRGYLTARTAYVVPTYYQRAPKRIRIINPKGISAYQKVNLTRRLKHYRKGQVLRVKRLVNYHLTMRLVLTNGRYITANKTLVKVR